MATIAANGGAYTIIGARSVTARVLSLDSGSYTLTGTAATTRRGFVLTAVSGSYTLTGGAIQSRRIAIEPAGYILNGTAANLFKGSPRLAIDSGSYTITGSAVNFERAIPYNRGSYTLTGTDATLSRSSTPTLGAVSGSYAITGGLTRLEATLTIDSGDYNTTGTAATLRRGKGFVALGGTYTITAGPQVLLKAARKFTGATTSYAITGSLANLNYVPNDAKFILIDGGSYTLTGQAATLRPTRKIDAVAGSYAISGKLVQIYRLYANGGAYAITGTAATLIKSTRVIAANSGSYSIVSPQLVIDTTNKSNGGTFNSNTTSRTWSHTVAAGANRVLVVEDTHHGGQSNRIVSSVTFNGLALVSARSVTSGGAGIFRFASIWYLINPPAVTANIVVTYSNTVFAGQTSAVSFTGAAQSSGFLIRDTAALSSTGTTASTTIPSAGNVDNIVIDAVVHTDSTITVGAGQTQLQNSTFSGGGGGATSYEIASASTTMSWALSVSALWSIVAVEFAPASATKLRLSTATFNRILFGDVGAYGITGFAATTKKTAFLTANAGVYTTTGTAAVINNTKILVASEGVYTWTGTDASLPIKLSATGGVYALTGTAATLQVTGKIAVDSGVYAISGQAATLLHDNLPKTILAESGAYATTGNPSILVRAFRVISGVGAYTLTGVAADLRHQIVALDSGTYAITGSNVALSTSQSGRWTKQQRGQGRFKKQPRTFKQWDTQLPEPGITTES